ncbi:LD-carboxypeptidase [Novosphingobium sp.]|uniref:LD-carboxypeptidase n=1 Tax=Novosphingobium sp. TaxID=1874826 RepID=UPI002608445B|nr:LD-carboxypeptidase [Novosphingobium sp.]
MIRVAICAPARSITPEDAARVTDLATAVQGVSLNFHPQCFQNEGHFAGSDAQRLAAFLECANDPAFGAVWFARGGYGSNRIVEDALPQLGEAANAQAYLGYSDTGYLLAGLYRARIGAPVHAPMPGDIRRAGGEAAVLRTLHWLGGDRSGEEPGPGAHPAVAFNLTTLAMLCGTPLMPDLTGLVVQVEEVSEHLYSVDRLFFHVTAHLRDVAGLRLGRLGDVPENDVPFGRDEEQIARHWCARSGIPYLGRADIGHDIDNKIVPFGLESRRARD